MIAHTSRLLQFVIETTETTIPDDFYIVFPEDVPDNVKDLASSGLEIGPLMMAALTLIVIGVAVITRRQRHG